MCDRFWLLRVYVRSFIDYDVVGIFVLFVVVRRDVESVIMCYVVKF